MSWTTWWGYMMVCCALRLAFWPALDAVVEGDVLGFAATLGMGFVHDGIAGLLLKHLARGDAHALPPGSGPGYRVPATGGTGITACSPMSHTLTID